MNLKIIIIVTILFFLWTMYKYLNEEEILTQGSPLPKGERGERKELWRAIELFFFVSLCPPPPLACAVARAAGLEP